MPTIPPPIYSTMVRAGNTTTFFLEVRELDGEPVVSLTEFRKDARADPCTCMKIPDQALARLRHALSKAERATIEYQEPKEIFQDSSTMQLLATAW